jgi:hypothetical protein
MKNNLKILGAAFLALSAIEAQAYVGPGAGLSAIGSILAFVGAILLIIVGFFWYPIKRLLKGKQESTTEEQVQNAADGNIQNKETSNKE